MPPVPKSEPPKKEAILDTMRNMPGKSVTLPDLVVAAWLRWPEMFSIFGYPRYPCSYTVRTHLNGELGLLARGYILKEGNTYRLSDSGVAVTIQRKEPDDNILDLVAENMRLQRKIAGEVVIPTCKNCGKVEALIDGYCGSPACEKKHLRTGRKD